MRQYDAPLTDRGVLRLPPRLRERYLDAEADTAVVQACGTELVAWVFSDRGDVRLSLALADPEWSRPYVRSLHRWGLNVNRWRSKLAADGTVTVTAEATTLGDPLEVLADG